MKEIMKNTERYPAEQETGFIERAIARHLGNEPKKEFNLFSRRTATNLIRMKVYNHCTFYLGEDEGGD